MAPALSLWSRGLLCISLLGAGIFLISAIQSNGLSRTRRSKVQAIFYLSTQITNMAFTESLLDPNSADYQNLKSEVDYVLIQAYNESSDSGAIQGNYLGTRNMSFSKGQQIHMQTALLYSLNPVNMNMFVARYIFVDYMDKTPSTPFKINDYSTIMRNTPFPTTTTKPPTTHVSTTTAVPTTESSSPTTFTTETTSPSSTAPTPSPTTSPAPSSSTAAPTRVILPITTKSQSPGTYVATTPAAATNHTTPLHNYTTDWTTKSSRAPITISPGSVATNASVAPITIIPDSTETNASLAPITIIPDMAATNASVASITVNPDSTATNSTIAPITVNPDSTATNTTVAPITVDPDSTATNTTVVPLTVNPDSTATNTTVTPITNASVAPITITQDSTATNTTGSPTAIHPGPTQHSSDHSNWTTNASSTPIPFSTSGSPVTIHPDLHTTDRSSTVPASSAPEPTIHHQKVSNTTATTPYPLVPYWLDWVPGWGIALLVLASLILLLLIILIILLLVRWCCMDEPEPVAKHEPYPHVHSPYTSHSPAKTPTIKHMGEDALRTPEKPRVPRTGMYVVNP